jgi:hypothetical protein
MTSGDEAGCNPRVARPAILRASARGRGAVRIRSQQAHLRGSVRRKLMAEALISARFSCPREAGAVFLSS